METLNTNIDNNNTKNNPLDLNQVENEGQKRNILINKARLLGDLEQFNYNNLEDFMSDEKIINFCINNWSTKENGEYLLDNNIIKNIKDSISEFLIRKSEGNIKTKNNFSVQVGKDSFFINGNQVDGLNNSEYKNIRIRFIGGELEYKEEANSMNSQIILDN